MTTIERILLAWPIVILIVLVVICRKGGSRRGTWRGGYRR